MAAISQSGDDDTLTLPGWMTKWHNTTFNAAARRAEEEPKAAAVETEETPEEKIPQAPERPRTVMEMAMHSSPQIVDILLNGMDAKDPQPRPMADMSLTDYIIKRDNTLQEKYPPKAPRFNL